jgi:hypothetical protein
MHTPIESHAPIESHKREDSGGGLVRILKLKKKIRYAHPSNPRDPSSCEAAAKQLIVKKKPINHLKTD